MTTVTKTSEALLEIENFRREVIAKINQREMISFNLCEITIDDENGMKYDGVKLEKDAMKKIFSFLRIKPNFLGFSKMMLPSDWHLVKEKLKAVGTNQQVWARKNSETGTAVIDEIHLAFPKNEKTISLDTVFTEILDAMTSSTKELIVRDKLFFSDRDRVVVTLVEAEEIDVLGNGTENWKVGKRITWDEVSFSVASYFENATGGCSVMGFKADISNKKYNIEKIHNVLITEIAQPSDESVHKLENAVSHLRAFNASVREMTTYKKFFNTADDEKYLAEKIELKEYDTAYGCVVEEKPTLWQSTADTNMKSIELFNFLADLGSNSHPRESGDSIMLDDKRKLEFQSKLANFLFKKKLDMELVAPKVALKEVKVVLTGTSFEKFTA